MLSTNTGTWPKSSRTESAERLKKLVLEVGVEPT